MSEQGLTNAEGVKMLAMLPAAAEEYRRQITLGLGGHSAEVLKARTVIRELVNGEIQLMPTEDSELWADVAFQPAALVQAGGTGHRDERI